MSSVWEFFGLKDSPYGSDYLPPSETGSRLLVGRDAELTKIRQLLNATKRHIVLEGENGVGKTSMVNVAIHRATQDFRERRTPQLFLPLRKPFQLTTTSTPEHFKREVLFELAQSLLAHIETLNLAGRSMPDTQAIETWLNSPLVRGGGAGVTVLGVGASGTQTNAANTSAGFLEAGLATAVESWLRDAFPTAASGAFVAVIDNLELLETSVSARGLLEALRDTVLSMPGTRWILCGARGIARSVASSTRLEGVLNEPIDVDPLPDAFVPALIERRIEAFKARPDAIAPVDPDGFRFLYDLLHSNLRNALRYSEDFAIWLHGSSTGTDSAQLRLSSLKSWASELAKRHLADTKSVGPRAWEVFDDLVALGGSCSPSDHAKFRYDTQMAMRPQVKSLEDAQLVQSTRDDEDQRRKTISVTPRGWLVRHARIPGSGA